MADQLPSVAPYAGAVFPHLYRPGLWHGAPGLSGTSNALGNTTVRVSPLIVSTTTRFDQVAIEVTAAGNGGAVFRPALYADNGVGYPGALILDPGTLAADAIANPVLVIDLTLPAGLYWFGGVVQNAATTQPTVRTLGSNQALPGTGVNTISGFFQMGYIQSSIAGALPATFTTTVGMVNGVPRPVLRAA